MPRAQVTGMDTVTKNMYTMRMVDASPRGHLPRFQARHGLSSPLGRIVESGLLHQRPWARMVPMRTLRKYALAYVVAGGGRYEDARGLQYRIEPGDLIFVFPDLPHSYGADERGWTELYLMFDGPIFPLWQRQGLLDPDRPVRHLEPVDYWLRRLQAVIGESNKPGWSPPLLEVCRLQLLLAESLVGSSPSQPHGDQEWASRACALIEAELTSPVDLALQSRQMQTSCATYRRRFRRIVGMPPEQYRRARRIDRACELMRATHMSVKEIAQHLGFYDAFHFSRCFKKLIGQSPREYRRALGARE